MTIDVEAARDFYQRLQQCCLTIVELVNLPSENPNESYLPAALAHGVGNDEVYFHKKVDRAREEFIAASEVVARIRRYVDEFEQPAFGEIWASADEMYVRPIHDLDFDEEPTQSAATRVFQTAKKVVSIFEVPSEAENDIEGNLEFAKFYCERYDALFAEVIGIDPREAFRGVASPDELIPKLIDDMRQEFRDVLQRQNQPISEDVRADFSKKDEDDLPASEEDQALIGLLVLEYQKPKKERNNNRVVRDFLKCDRSNAENKLRNLRRYKHLYDPEHRPDK